MKRYAVIVAGGKGLRMGNEVPKQFLPLRGKPVLMWTIDAFCAFDPTVECIVVLPEQQVAYWQNLCQSFGYDAPHTIVLGGAERFHSVRNGLSAIASEGVVAVHDGVRPFVSKEMLAAGFALAEAQGSAVPYVDSVDSLREIAGDDTRPLDRTKVKRIQTPQIFSATELKKAMDKDYRPQFTDEATVWELSGRKLHFYPGSDANLKITTQTDLAFAEILLKDSSPVRDAEFPR